MGNRQKPQSKMLLYNSAKALFYEKGYNSTSVRDIVTHANSKLGLFTYYFEGKDALAVTVFNEFAATLKKAVHEVVEAHYPGIYDDYLFQHIFEHRCSQYLYILDPQITLFFNELMFLQRFIDRRYQEKEFYFGELLEKATAEKLSPMLRTKGYEDMTLCMVSGMELFFCRKLCAGEISVPIDDAMDILLKNYYSFFLTDKKRISEVLALTRQVLDHLSFEITGPFQVSVRYLD